MRPFALGFLSPFSLVVAYTSLYMRFTVCIITAAMTISRDKRPRSQTLLCLYKALFNFHFFKILGKASLKSMHLLFSFGSYTPKKQNDRYFWFLILLPVPFHIAPVPISNRSSLRMCNMVHEIHVVTSGLYNYNPTPSNDLRRKRLVMIYHHYQFVPFNVSP